MVNPMSILQSLIVNLLLLISLSAQAADIQVSVDRNPVNVNDSFQIIFTANQEPDGSPDFSPLEDNFEILDQQRSSNASWINGQSNRIEKWILRVLAKQSGELLIPPIAFGNDSSKPLSIVVSESRATTPQTNDEIFLEVTATPDKPYVQSQVLYSLKLYRRVLITQAKLDEPQLKDAVIEKLGEDSTYNSQVQGVSYTVTERKYAIFPQQSGVFTIAPLTLNAEVLIQRRPSFNGFFNQQSTENRRISSNAITLNVQPVPANFKNSNWLSAESLQLSENWSDKSMQTKVGEPLTRTMRLTAKGSTVGQLPELSGSTVIDGIKSYPDQPVLKEDKQDDGLTAVREEKIAYIPSKPGDYTLPALKISWFNTKTQKVEILNLPSVTIKALASSEASQQAPKTPASDIKIETPAISTSVVNNENGDSRFWQGLSAFLALGWLLTILAFYLRLIKKSSQTDQTKGQLPNSAIEKALKRACWENNPQAAKQAVLQWGRIQFGSDSLGSIARLCSEPLQTQIENLNQLLYSGQQKTWIGEHLWEAFSKNHIETGTVSAKDEGLEPLYKL